MDSFEGSCLCQTVKVSISGEVHGFFLCHCLHCRKVTGSAHAANIFVKVKDVTWHSGESKVSGYKLPDSRFEKSFCSLCSSAVPTVNEEGFAAIPAGCLDSELTIKPNAHIFCASRASWDDGFIDVPKQPAWPG